MNPKIVPACPRRLRVDDGAMRPRRIGLREIALPLAIPAALGLGAGVAGCGSSTPVGEQGEEICDNGVDDNEDGLVDCSDPLCEGVERCRDVEPGCAPRVEYCEDGFDNNGNGDTDCDDLCCDAFCFARDCPGCLYGVPFEPLPNEVDCVDGLDEDCDGQTDCCDSDCDDEPACLED